LKAAMQDAPTMHELPARRSPRSVGGTIACLAVVCGGLLLGAIVGIVLALCLGWIDIRC